METIAQSVVDGVAFDKTILCTITDDSDKENGRYQVTDGSSNFIAYSEVKTFRNKELVYVTVPNGDFSEQKIIIGKKADLEDEPFNYARPFDNLLSCTPNIFGEFSGLATNYKLIANSTIDKEVNPEKDEDKELFGQTLNNFNGGFTRLGLRVKFQSLLTRELIKTGNYGIKLILTVFRDDVVSDNTYYYTEVDTSDIDFKNRTKYNPNFTNENDKYSFKEGTTNYWFYNNIDNNYMMYNFTGADTDWPEGITFYIQQQQQKMEELSFIIDTKDMVGNPYAFEVPYTQEKLFDISNINQIKKAEVIFFQDQDFTKVDGTVLPVAQMANLFASDLELYFGYDLSEIQDEFIRLYTFDSLNYQHADNEEENRKEIDLRWAHRTDDKIEIFTKENLESWYNDIFDNGEEMKAQYTMRLDDSETPVENRIYYKMDKRFEADGIWRYYNKGMNIPGNDDVTGDLFELNSQQPFSCVFKESPLEQFFEKRRFRLIDFKESPQIKYFTYLNANKEEVDISVLKLFQAHLQERVLEKFPASMMNSSTNFSDYIFYLFENGQRTPVSILGENDFIPGKIYYYETYKETSMTLEEAFDNNSNISNIYITLYSPIAKDDESYDIKLNTFSLYRANFVKVDAGSENSFYVTFSVTEDDYKKDTCFYKSYDLKDSFEIRWYRYQLGAPAADEYCGIYWTRIPNQQGEEAITCVDADEPAFHCVLYPDSIYNKTEQIKVIILIKQDDGSKKAYYSNTLIFENKDDVISIPTTMQEMALRLQIDDNSDGNYYLYDESNHIIDNSLSPLSRTLTVLFDKDNFQSRTQLVNAEKVVWTFPIANTMMKIDTIQTGGSYAVSPANSSYGTLTINELKTDGYKLYYSIEDTFSYQSGNNTITCTIVKDGETFSTTQEFSFGQSGSNGSDYTLVLDLLTSDNMITVNPKNNLQAFSPYTETDYDENKTQPYRYDETVQELSLVGRNLISRDNLGNIYKRATIVQNNTDKTNDYVLVAQDKTTDIYTAFFTTERKFIQDDIFNNGSLVQSKLQEFFDKLENQYYYKDEEDQIYKPLSIAVKAIVRDFNALSTGKTTDGFFNLLEGKLYYVPLNQCSLYGYAHTVNSYKVINTSTPIEENLIRATLRDQSGNLVPGEYEVEWSFYTQSSVYTAVLSEEDQIKNFFDFSSESTPLGDSVVLLQKTAPKKLIDPQNNDVTLQFDNILNTFIIVQATLKGFGDYDLTSYLPIPLRKDYGITRYQGPTQVIYSSTGFPNYYKDEINLYYNNAIGDEDTYSYSGFRIMSFQNLIYENRNDNKNIVQEDYLPTLNLENGNTYSTVYREVTSSTLNSGTDYYIKNADGLYEKVNIFDSDTNQGHSDDKRNQVSLSDLKQSNGTLYTQERVTDQEFTRLVFSPMSTFIQGFSTYAIQYIYNKEILFTQPVLNIQNRYFSSTINKWDGALSIDEEKNTILAKMIGAGRKDRQNRFSGVIMGDWSGNVNTNDGGNVSLANNIGLYGFNNGETSFGFTSEGIGFIGKAGRGRILLDGDNSVITSSNWVMTGGNNNSATQQGLYMKIDDGFLLLRDSSTGHYIKLDVMADGKPAKKGKSFSDDVYSPTTNPHPSDSKGLTSTQNEYPFVIFGDKKNYTAIGWNGNMLLSGTRDNNTSTNGEDDVGYIYLNAAAEKYPLDINNHFAVAWNGALTISKSNISSFNVNTSTNADKNKGDIVFAESTSSIIAKDDQRGYFINGSETESDGLRKHDSTNTTVTNTNTTTSEADPTYDYTTINTSTTLHDINSNDNLTDSTKNFQKKDNPYDYSEINTGFHGLYASPEGDLYLSRKLIIGSKFSATADGYLRAHSALFDDCNANVFEVRYIPETATAAIDLNKNHIVDSETVNNNEDNQGAKIGKMGWIKGSRGIVDGKEQNTWNLGFKSYKNAGIVCEAYTNLRMEAGITDGDKDPLHAKRTMYLNAPNEELNAEYALRLTAGDSAKNTTLGYKRANVITRIDIASYGTIDEVARSQIRMGTHGDAIQGNVGVFDPHDSDTATDYGVEFLLRDPLADANTKQVVTGINDNTGGDGENTDDEEDYGLMALAEDDDDDQSGSTTTTTKYGLARLQVKGLARLSLGPDTSWKSTESANRFLVDVFSSKQVTVPDGSETTSNIVNGKLRMYYDGTKDNKTGLDTNSLFNGGLVSEMTGFNAINLAADQGVFIYKSPVITKGTDEYGNEIDVSGPESLLRFELNGDSYLNTGQFLKIHSFGSTGAKIELLQDLPQTPSQGDLLGGQAQGPVYYINVQDADNFGVDRSDGFFNLDGTFKVDCIGAPQLFSSMYMDTSSISFYTTGQASFDSLNLTTVGGGGNFTSEGGRVGGSTTAWNSDSISSICPNYNIRADGKFYLYSSSVEFSTTGGPSAQTGIYARFA